MPANIVTFPSASIQLATTPGTDLYTCPAGTRARIDKLVILNTTATGYTVTVHIARAGAANADNNQIVSAAPIPIETTAPNGVELYGVEGQVLNPTDVLRAFSSGASGAALTAMGSVTEFS